MPIKAPVSMASSLPKTGSPRPTGTLLARTSTTPPRVSPSWRAIWITSAMASTWSGSAQYSGLRAISTGS